MQLAAALDQSKIKAVSIEDAHKPNDLSQLLPLFKHTTVVLGCVAVACSKVESQAAIEARLTEALKYIDRCLTLLSLKYIDRCLTLLPQVYR